MNGISKQVNKELYSVKQAAGNFKISRPSYLKLLNKYLPQLDGYVKYVNSKGRSGKTVLISKEGLVVLSNLKNPNYKSNSASDASLQGKKKIAEVAIAKSTQDVSSLLREIGQLRMEIQEVKQLAIEAPPTDLVTSQREFLNDRLRYYCQQTELTHSYVWKKLHGYIGRDSINDYKFGDFKPAIRYLKEMYKAIKLEWN